MSSLLEPGGLYDKLPVKVPFDAYIARRERQQPQSTIPAQFPDRRALRVNFSCGTAIITATMAAISTQSAGVDISPSMRHVPSHEAQGAKYYETDLTLNDLDLGSFDLSDASTMNLHQGSLRRLLKHDGLQPRHLQPVGGWMLRSRYLKRYQGDASDAATLVRGYSCPWSAAWSPNVIVFVKKV